jgi:hypothetical protein
VENLAPGAHTVGARIRRVRQVDGGPEDAHGRHLQESDWALHPGRAEGLFSVRPPFVVDQNRGTNGQEAWEEAWFHIPDMGELYRVGIARLTPELRALVNTPEGVLAPTALAWLDVKLHLGERETRTGAWTPASELEASGSPATWQRRRRLGPRYCHPPVQHFTRGVA